MLVLIRTSPSRVNKEMNPDRLAKYESLCEHASHFPEIALRELKGDRRVYHAMVFIPHQEFATPFAKRVHEMFLNAGFAVDTHHSLQVSGPEFIVTIRTLSPWGYKGLTFHSVYLPTVHGLLPHQIKNLRKIASDVGNYREYMDLEVVAY